MEQQFDLFIQDTNAQLVIQTQDVSLQIDAPNVELSLENVEQQLIIENPIVELAVADTGPAVSHDVYEPWDKTGIQNAFQSIQTAIQTPTPTLHDHDIINEESLNRHKTALDEKLNTVMSFLTYLVHEITK